MYIQRLPGAVAVGGHVDIDHAVGLDLGPPAADQYILLYYMLLYYIYDIIIYTTVGPHRPRPGAPRHRHYYIIIYCFKRIIVLISHTVSYYIMFILYVLAGLDLGQPAAEQKSTIIFCLYAASLCMRRRSRPVELPAAAEQAFAQYYLFCKQHYLPCKHRMVIKISNSRPVHFARAAGPRLQHRRRRPEARLQGVPRRPLHILLYIYYYIYIIIY